MKTPAKENLRKVTVNLPASLIDGAMKGNRNLTEVIREALKRYNHHRACQDMLALEGKVKFDMTWQELRDKAGDRDLGKFLKKSRKKR